MTAEEKRVVVNEILESIQANAIDVKISFNIDEEGYLCVITESVGTGKEVTRIGKVQPSAELVNDVAKLKEQTSNLEVQLQNIEGTEISGMQSTLTNLNSVVTGENGLSESLTKLKTSLETLVSGNTSEVIESFNEVVAFLSGIKDDKTLSGILLELDGKINGVVSSALANGNVRFGGIEKDTVTFETSTPTSATDEAVVVWCEKERAFALRASGRYYKSWSERALYMDEKTTLPYTTKQYILNGEIYMFDGTALDKTGGAGKTSDYLISDVRALEIGKTYSADEAIKTEGGKLRRMTKDVLPLNLTDVRWVGDLVAYGNDTYCFVKSIGKYSGDVTYQNGDYAVKDGAVCVMNNNAWSAATLTDMIADATLVDRKDAAWLEGNATEQNSVNRDIFDNRQEVILDINKRLSIAKNGRYIVNGVETSYASGVIVSPVRLLAGDIITIVANNLRMHGNYNLISKVDEQGDYSPLYGIANGNNQRVVVSYVMQEDCNVVFSFNNPINIGVNTTFKVARRSKGSDWFGLNHKKQYNNWLYSSLISKVPAIGEKFDYGGVNGAGEISLTKRQLIACKGGDRFVVSGDNIGWFVANESDVIVLDSKSIFARYVKDFEVEIPEGGKYLVVYGKNDENISVYKKVGTEMEAKEVIDEDITNNHPIIDIYALAIPDVGEKFEDKTRKSSNGCHIVPVVGGEVYSLTAWLKDNIFSGYALLDYNMIVVKKVEVATKEFTCGEIIEIPYGVCFLVFNTSKQAVMTTRLIRVKSAKSVADANQHKEAVLMNMQSKQKTHRLTFAWTTDTHNDSVNYKRFIGYANEYKGIIDAVLHTGDMNYSADSDNGFVNTVLKYTPQIPLMPVLGNHDAFGMVKFGDAPTSGSKKWNGEKYIKPFMDDKCVSGDDNCYYYRDFAEQKIRVIAVNDFDKPRWVDCKEWVTVTDEVEKARAVEWSHNTQYEVGKVVHYKGLYLKCKVASRLDNDAHRWPAQYAPTTKTPVLCRYFTKEQVEFIVNAMNVESGWSIVFVGHQCLENTTAENVIPNANWHFDKKTEHKFGQNGYILQDLITAYINRTTLQKTYECITPNVNPTGSVVKTNMPDFYPDVSVDVDFSGAKGDVICFLHGHQHFDSCYQSRFCGELKFLAIGLTTGCVVPTCMTQTQTVPEPWAGNDILRGGASARDSFNIISFDTDEKAVYLLRMGADVNSQFVERKFARISYAHK
ncbi:metallophosphoesterase family protein [Prevotella koreensis]